MCLCGILPGVRSHFTSSSSPFTFHLPHRSKQCRPLWPILAGLNFLDIPLKSTFLPHNKKVLKPFASTIPYSSNLDQFSNYQAMAAAQPIALPTNTNDYDQIMGSGSFTGQNGSFNPASYTRRFLGSPASFRAGSFGSRFYPGVSPGQLLGPLEYAPLSLIPPPTGHTHPSLSSPNDFRLGKVSSSIESDRGSLMNTLNVFERQDELVSTSESAPLPLPNLSHPSLLL